MHQLIQALPADREGSAAVVMAEVSSKADTVPTLAYRPHTVWERKNPVAAARRSHRVIQSWPEIAGPVVQSARAESPPGGLFTDW